MGIRQEGPGLFSTFNADLCSRPRSWGHLTSGLTSGRRGVAHTRHLLAADGCMDSLSSHGGCNAAGDMVALFSCGLGDRLKTYGEEVGCEGELPDHQLGGIHQADEARQLRHATPSSWVASPWSGTTSLLRPWSRRP